METVNDGQFHSVELVMLNQTLNLVVDKGAPKSLGKLQKQPVVDHDTPLYIGGEFAELLLGIKQQEICDLISHHS